jgi:hypothetical protein
MGGDAYSSPLDCVKPLMLLSMLELRPRERVIRGSNGGAVGGGCHGDRDGSVGAETDGSMLSEAVQCPVG